MCDFSRDYPETAICFGAPDFENDDIYICHYVVQKGKIIFRHRKTVLGPGERQTYRQAEYAAVFHDMILPDSVNVSIGMQICAETHIPELSAALADQGAEILLMPFASPRESASEKLNRFKRFLPARAYDNSCFTACCNQIWKTEKFGKSPGAALILSPRGIVISESSSGEESYVSGTIDLKEINTIKSSKMGYFRDWVIKSPPGKGKA